MLEFVGVTVVRGVGVLILAWGPFVLSCDLRVCVSGGGFRGVVGVTLSTTFTCDS